MSLHIRAEASKDYEAIEALIEAAFAPIAYSDHQEQHLVARLRRAPTFVSDYALVAEWEGMVVGHVLLTPAQVQGEARSHPVLALAPLSVKPDHQGQGIGSALMEAAHAVARKRGAKAIVLLGEAAYYQRFGYVPASTQGIRFPFEAPDEACLLLELEPAVFAEGGGTVVYPQAFGIDLD